MEVYDFLYMGVIFHYSLLFCLSYSVFLCLSLCASLSSLNFFSLSHG